ncbi:MULTISPECIES: DUF6893 family small protein [unclassified Streptomyces]
MSKNVIATTFVAVTAALAAATLLKGVLPDIQRYLRISRM